MGKNRLFDTWARRNPKFETHMEHMLLRKYTDYGVGASQLTEAKGKSFGAGYELYIYAFFIGLYFNKRRKLSDKSKTLGQDIQYWGNVGNKIGRKAYSSIQKYIFMALIARTTADDGTIDFWMQLEKGEITERKVVDMLIETMEEYANYGFYYMIDKIDDNPNYFFQNKRFLDCILEASFESNEDEALEDAEALL